MQGQVIGNYKIFQKIGEGGMGEVFLGKDLLLERDVAIKALRPELGQRQDIVERFRTEAVALARLNHPNIATLYNYIVHEDQYYMVLEFVRGERLDQMLTRRAPLPCIEVLSIVGSILEGLGHAHKLGIVHRDIKTSNIMMTNSGRLKIMDFGIARILQSARLTRTGHLIGTLEYMSPEQIKGLETNAQTDIYSSGIVAYELLTGQTPFIRDTDYEIIKAQVEEQPANIKEIRPDVPKAVVDVVSVALEKEPQNRYASAKDFLESIEAVARTISDDPVRVNAIKVAPETRFADIDTNIAHPAPSAFKTSILQQLKKLNRQQIQNVLWSTLSRNKALWFALPMFVVFLIISGFYLTNKSTTPIDQNNQNPTVKAEKTSDINTSPKTVSFINPPEITKPRPVHPITLPPTSTIGGKKGGDNYTKTPMEVLEGRKKKPKPAQTPVAAKKKEKETATAKKKPAVPPVKKIAPPPKVTAAIDKKRTEPPVYSPVKANDFSYRLNKVVKKGKNLSFLLKLPTRPFMLSFLPLRPTKQL